MFNLDQLRQHSWLRGLEFHPSIDSTNRRAVELAGAADVRCPYLVLAQVQTSGKGRGANRWWSDAGALTFSLLVEPAALGITTERWPRTSLCAALAVCDVIAERAPGLECGVKWPNDVYLAARKVCGVLVEAPPRKADLPHRLVVGVGVNVNNSLRDAPDDVRNLATSLSDETGATHDMTDVLSEIITRFVEFLRLLAADDDALPARWQQHSLLDGRTVTVDQNGRLVTGYCIGINREGALDLATPLGVEAVISGVVRGVSPEFRVR